MKYCIPIVAAAKQVVENVVYHHVYRNRDGYDWIQYTRGNGQQGFCAVRDLSTGEEFGYAE